jgi:pSer/pThr/pTyr-binding forkhead associated (FHA) protein
MMGLVLTFLVTRKGRGAKSVAVSDAIIRIGNDPRSQLCLDDEAVSLMHAVIEVDGDASATLIDLGSPIGTWVNGARVNRCKLSAGDEIRVATTHIQVESIT